MINFLQRTVALACDRSTPTAHAAMPDFYGARDGAWVRTLARSLARTLARKHLSSIPSPEVLTYATWHNHGRHRQESEKPVSGATWMPCFALRTSKASPKKELCRFHRGEKLNSVSCLALAISVIHVQHFLLLGMGGCPAHLCSDTGQGALLQATAMLQGTSCEPCDVLSLSSSLYRKIHNSLLT